MINLLDYRQNHFSQNGEDGIISFIFKTLNIDKGFFVEFGANNGPNCSNTWSLAQNGWGGIYIEPDTTLFSQLTQNCLTFGDNVKCVNKFVNYEGSDMLDHILSENGVKNNFDFLSIDIDSYDYHVWKSLEKFKPKVVIIEINSSIPEGHFQTHNPPEEMLTSFSSMIELGISKGYRPLCHTGNIIFIDNEIEFPEVNFYQLRNWIGLFSNPFKQV